TAEVRCLVLSIGHEARDVFESQHHFGVLLERCSRVGFFVLAANRQDYAASGEGFDVSLERHEGFADGIALADVDSAESIIADHPTPERVVEVEHQALAASPD